MEGTNIANFTDAKGVRVGECFLHAAQNGGDFVKYLWDNPAKEGDKRIGSVKVSYVRTFTTKDGKNLIVGSGFHPFHPN